MPGLFFKKLAIPSNISTYLSRTLIVITVATTVMIGGVMIFQQTLYFDKVSKQKNKEYIDNQKIYIQEIVNNELEYIRIQNEVFKKQINNKIKQNVNQAFYTAETIYEKYTGKKSDEEIKALIIRCQDNAGRVAAGRSDQPRLADGVAPEFRAAIHGLRQQRWRRMLVRIEILIDLRAPQPEIGAEVNDPQPFLQQRHGKLRRHAVRQRQKRHFRLPRDIVHFRLGENEFAAAGKLGEGFSKRLAGLLARRDASQLDGGMRQQQPHQLFAGVATGSNNGDFDLVHVTSVRATFMARRAKSKKPRRSAGAFRAVRKSD